MQLHIEWATPAVVKGEGQERGNSGVFLMNRYEVQVLDSYGNETYYHGQAGAVYKQYAPLVNASRKPGEWQAYDIIFHAPKFDEQGKVVDRARVTVLQNGVLIQNNVEIYGITYNDRPALYIPHSPQESPEWSAILCATGISGSGGYKTTACAPGSGGLMGRVQQDIRWRELPTRKQGTRFDLASAK